MGRTATEVAVSGQVAIPSAADVSGSSDAIHVIPHEVADQALADQPVAAGLVSASTTRETMAAG